MQVYEMEKIMTEISNILEEDVGAFDRDEAADVMDLIFDLREKQTYFTPDLHKTLFLGRVQRNKMAVSMSHRQQRGTSLLALASLPSVVTSASAGATPSSSLPRSSPAHPPAAERCPLPPRVGEPPRAAELTRFLSGICGLFFFEVNCWLQLDVC